MTLCITVIVVLLLQFYQEELSRERLRVQQEMQVGLIVFVPGIIHLCAKPPSHLWTVLSIFIKAKVIAVFFSSTAL